MAECTAWLSVQPMEGSMDAANILVVVLTTAAVGWLVWIEFQCPCNHVKQTPRDCRRRQLASQPAANEFGAGNDESVLAAEG